MNKDKLMELWEKQKLEYIEKILKKYKPLKFKRTEVFLVYRVSLSLKRKTSPETHLKRF